MRVFVFFAGSVLALSQTRPLTILHTNDLHARLQPDDRKQGGLPYVAAVLRKERAGCGHCLHLSAGDIVQGTPVSTIFKGVPLFDVANKLGIDAFTLGNHEFDYGYAQLPVFIRRARFAIVSANIVDGNRHLVPPYVIRKVGGLRVGIIGAVMGNLTSGFLKPGAAGPWKVTPVVETVARYAREIRGRCDVVVVLGHILDREEASVILEKVPEVNVVVVGHSHAGRKEMEVRDGRVAVEVRGYGVEVGRLQLDVDVSAKKLTRWEWKRIPVDSASMKPAADVAKLAAKLEGRVAKIVDRPIAESRDDMTTAEVKALFDIALREEMKTDFGYLNQGGIRDRIARGVVLERVLWNIFPFDNEVMVARIRGDRIPERIRGKQPVDASKEYSVAMPDFAAQNEASRKSLGMEDVQFESTGRDLRDVMIEWTKKKKILTRVPAPTQR
ncbi:MAG: bifunctional metallophosphatase/5'-nucleotidase [Candidatus Solibacter usitatus]|nr:bifunctional metallophosphatase/5'-nucleotidase [Candidatus Solibacter usitatus]